jgi:hypothetical protein
MSNKWRDTLTNCHLNPWLVLLAFVVLFGSIFLASGADPTGGSWVLDGGDLIDGLYPGLADWLDVKITYAIFTDGSLRLRSNLGTWYNLGGQVTSSPVVCTDRAGWDHVFVRGTDGHLWDRRVDIAHITATEAPGDWIDLGGYIKEGTSPAIRTFHGEAMRVLVHGSDDGLWGKETQVTTGSTELSTPEQGPWANLGGKIVGSPNFGWGLIAVRGSDNSLWVNEWDPIDNPTSTWHPLGGVLASDPSVGRDSTDMLIYAKGSDGALWVNKFYWSAWSGVWIGLGGQISGSASPTPSYFTPDKSAHVFVKGTDNGLWDCVDGTWYNLGGQITSKPQIKREIVDLYWFDVYVRGSDGALWRYVK